MTSFLRKFNQLVLGVLNGFDRLFFRGTLRNLAYREGLQHYLWANRIPYKDFAAHSQAVTKRLEEASLRQARQEHREVRYLNSHQLRLEDEAQQLAARDHISQGLIGVFRRVEPCMSFQIHKNYRTKKLEITYRPRQCLHLYHYQIHPVFGFMHARIQTWFPFHVYVCINGHEWLARQMDRAGLGYQRRDNCFPWVEDLVQAQALFDQQLQAHWPGLLDGLAHALNPIHQELFARYPTRYYWSVAQSEWASDVQFRSRADLQTYYPRWVRHAITTYGAVDILRFLGRRLSAAGQVPLRFDGDVQSNVHEREEGVRVKHWLNHNSLKLYDKGSVLRAECTINDPEDFRVYRPKEGDDEGAKAWRPMRYGIADCHRRAEVSQAANARYLEALAAVEDTTPLRQLVEPLCQPVPERSRAAARPPQASPAAAGDQRATALLPEGPSSRAPARQETSPEQAPPDQEAPRPRRRLRALNPFGVEDGALLEAVSRPEFLINGLRNRDLRALLYASPASTKAQERRRSAAIGRKLRLLRGHGLLRKVPKTHRYQVTDNGRTILTALLAARDANAAFLATNAA